MTTYRHLSNHRKSPRDANGLIAGMGPPPVAQPHGPEDFRPMLGAPRSQLSEPACTGFAGCFLAQGLWGLKYGTPPNPYAPRFLWYQERVLEGSQNASVGATGADTIRVLTEQGVCFESSMPYAEGLFAQPPSAEAINEAGGNKLRHPAHVNHHNLEEVDQVLAAQQPILLTISVYDDLYSSCPPNGEIAMKENMGDEVGSHEVLCAGRREDGRYIVWFGSWPGFGDACSVYFDQAYWRAVVFDAFTANLRDD